MREIKFRCFINGKMRYGIYPGQCCDAEWLGEEGGSFNLDAKENLMQFTGLVDKNGKDIYEGDILRDKDEHINVGQVGFELGSFYCTCSMGCDFYKWAYRYGEVIGNVHENPELLKQDSPSVK